VAEPSSLKAHQLQFAAHLRDPDNNPAPADVEARRMKIYSDLFINSVRRLLAGNFPILSKILGEQRWEMLTRDFYRDHRSHSPLFPDLPREFLHYLAEERADGFRSDPEPDYPFMYELAHYEWVEAGLMLAPDPQIPTDMNPAGDLLEAAPVTSSLAWLLAYEWPVNEIGVDSLPEQPADQPLYYLVYRNHDDEVIFTRLNAVSARLFELLGGEDALTGRQALEQIAEELGHKNKQTVVANGAGILRDWRDRGVLIGTL
jgi:hypothetical protein